MAVELTRDLASYAFGLIKDQPLKCFVMIEDDDGNRFWAANGKLRSEFLHDRKVENRSWGMFEQENVSQVNLGSLILKDHSSSDPSRSSRRDRDRDRDRKRGNSPRRRSHSHRDRERDRDRRPSRHSDANADRSDRSPHRSGDHSKHSVHDIQYLKDRGHNLDEVDFEAAGHGDPTSVGGDFGDLRPSIFDSGRFDSGSGGYDPLQVASEAAAVEVCPSCGNLGHDVPDCPLRYNERPTNTGGAFMDAYEGGNNFDNGFGNKFGNNFGNGDGLFPRPSLMEVPPVPSGMINLEDIHSGPSQHRCFNCHNPGHFAAECPLFPDIRYQLPTENIGDAPLVLDQGTTPDNRPCFNCSKKGHIAAECPEPPKDRKNRGKRAKAKNRGGVAKNQGGTRNVFKRQRDSKSKEKKSADASSRHKRSRSPRKVRSPSPDGGDRKAREELQPLLRTLEERGTLKYKWLIHSQKYLLVLPNPDGKSDILINVENVQDLSEASEKYGFLDDVNVVKEQVAPAKPSSTGVNEDPPPKDHPLAQSLAQLEEKALLRYKWLANSRKYLLIIPNGASNSDTLVNIGSMEELVDAAKAHGFGHGISPLLGQFDAEGAATASSDLVSTSAATTADLGAWPSSGDDLLAGTLADLASRETLRYKWLPNAKQYLIIIPQNGKSDILVNVSNMKQLLEAARKHDFTILGD